MVKFLKFQKNLEKIVIASFLICFDVTAILCVESALIVNVGKTELFSHSIKANKKLSCFIMLHVCSLYGIFVGRRPMKFG